jgi:hypothetical protein
MISDDVRAKLCVSSAILTRNRRELERAVVQGEEEIGEQLLAEAVRTYALAPIPGEYRLLMIVSRLPARLQHYGQRAVLLTPRIAHRLLRSSGLHHRMF